MFRSRFNCLSRRRKALIRHAKTTEYFRTQDSTSDAPAGGKCDIGAVFGDGVGDGAITMARRWALAFSNFLMRFLASEGTPHSRIEHSVSWLRGMTCSNAGISAAPLFPAKRVSGRHNSDVRSRMRQERAQFGSTATIDDIPFAVMPLSGEDAN